MKAKISTIILALFAFFWMPQISQAQITTYAPEITGCPGTQVVVPITVDNFDQVASLSITLNIDPSVITYVSYTNNPGMAGGFLVVNSPAPYTQVKAAWFGLTPLTLANGSVLFSFTFNYLQGSCPLTWDLVTNGNCAYSDLFGTILPSVWNDGSVSSTSPVIIAQPNDIAVNEGEAASFDANATDAEVFQWQVSDNGGSTFDNISDGVEYTGTSSATMTVNSTTMSMNGYQFRCTATATACNITVNSDPATLTVNSLTNDIIAQIGSAAGCMGANVLLPVTTFNFDNVGAMTLTINYNPSLTFIGLANENSLFDGTLNATAAGGVLTVTWSSVTPVTIGSGTLFDIEFNFAGASAVSFNTALCSFLDGGANPLNSNFIDGNVTSSASAPSITANPTNQTINLNGTATFNITATGADNYLWQVGTTASGPWVDLTNTTPYSGVTTNSLTITGTPLTLDGHYYRCVAGENICMLSSASGAGMLTVLPLTNDIVTTIGSITICPGDFITIPVSVVNFNNVASASMKINYDTLALTFDSVNTVNPALTAGVLVFNAVGGQFGMAWFAITPATFGSGLLFNMVFHYDANSSPLTFDLTPGTCQYTDIDFNELPALWVNGAVNIPGPVINTMPMSQTAFVGTNAVFTLSGTNIDSYQWQRLIGGTWTDLADGTDYTGVNTNSLTVNNCVLTMDGFQYRCAVNGVCGVQYSYIVNLMVINATPIVTTLPTIVQCQGPVTVPVNVADFNDVGSFSLTFHTTGNVLSYNGYQGANAALQGLSVTNTPNTITISWTGTAPVSLGSATLVTIKFNSLAGNTPLTWDITPGVCYFKSISNTVLPKTLNAGNVTINAFPGPPSAIQGPSTVCQNSGTSSYSTTGASNADSYVWAIIPSNAGSIAGTGLTAVITWDVDFTGLATVTVKGVNACGNGPIMSKAVTVVAVPVVTLDPFAPVCDFIDTLELTGGLPTGGVYSGNGVVNGNFLPNTVGPGTYDITYTVTNAGCSASQTQSILVKATPVVTLTLNVTNVCYYWPAFALSGGSPLGGTYSGIGVNSGNGMFTPTQAIIGDRVVTYAYTLNGCTGSATGIIHVDGCIDIPESNGLSIQVMPNPTQGIFRINVLNVNEGFELGLYNDLGQKVFVENVLPQNNEFSKDVDLSNQPKGLYFLKLTGKEGVRIEKIVLN
ncbi:MAG: cohesin domain-containing protein [Bacteroidales bacterium]